MKNNILGLLSATLPEWVTVSFPIIRIVIISICVLLGLALIFIVLIQQSNSEGMSGITGQSETFYSRNKTKTTTGMLKRLTAVISIALFVLSILFFITLAIYAGNI